MAWTIRQPAEHQLRSVNKFFERHIVGFDTKSAEHEETLLRARAGRFLATDENGVVLPSIWLAAYEGKELVGAVNVVMPYPHVLTAAGHGFEDLARGLARARRTVCGLAVREDMRRQGIANALIQGAEAEAKAQSASLLAGFMDEKNGAPAFYEANGYTTMPRNKPLPYVGEFPIREAHPQELNGQWFYKEI
jgi:GNAT superfamily N-acetyltransferase